MTEAEMIELMRKKLKSLNIEVGDEDLTDALYSAEQAIKNFCHIASVPEALKYVWRDMACGYYLQAKYASGALESVLGAGNVSQIKEGDTTVNFQTVGGGDRVGSLINGLLNQKSELVHFRKLCNE